MVLKTFNSLDDDLKITASILRVGTISGDLILEASHNLIFNISGDIIINNTGKIDASQTNLLIRNISAQDISACDISARNISVDNIYLSDKTDIHFGTETLDEIINGINLQGDASLNNVDISGKLRFIDENGTTTSIIEVDSTNQNQLIIDPAPTGNPGTLRIRGNLIVDGSTTTINSTDVDISDRILTLALGTDGTDRAGIQIGDSAYASFIYNDHINDKLWSTNIGMNISGGLKVTNGNTTVEDLSVNDKLTLPKYEFSGNTFVTRDSTAQIPVTFSTFKFKNSDLLTCLLNDQSANNWIDLTPFGYVIDISLMSNKSAVKLEFKANYICSQEADQFISFKVCRDTGEEVVFQDLSIGNSMGVTARNIYFGNYIDTCNNLTTYRKYYLKFRIDDGGNNLEISSGVLGEDTHNYNYIMAQELYIPE